MLWSQDSYWTPEASLLKGHSGKPGASQGSTLRVAPVDCTPGFALVGSVRPVLE